MGLSDYFRKRHEKKEAKKKQKAEQEQIKKAEEKSDTASQNDGANNDKESWRDKQFYIETHKENIESRYVPRFDDNYNSFFEDRKRSREDASDYMDTPFVKRTPNSPKINGYYHDEWIKSYSGKQRPKVIGDNFEYAIFEVIQEYLHPHYHLGWLNHLFKDKEYHAYVMSNLLIPNGTLDQKSEVDCMVISRKGIIVIEAKSHLGSFDGDIMDRRWDYYPHANLEMKHSLSNPFYQNASHISAIQRAINYSDYFGRVDKMNELAIDLEYKMDLEGQGIDTQWILSDYDATYDLASMDLEEYEAFCKREPYPDPIMASGKEHFQGHYWDIPIMSAIVINNACEISPNIQAGLKKKLNRNYKLIRFCNLPYFLHDIFDSEYVNEWPDVLTDKEVDHMYKTMCQYRNPSWEEQQKHIDFAKETGRRRENNYI